MVKDFNKIPVYINQRNGLILLIVVNYVPAKVMCSAYLLLLSSLTTVASRSIFTNFWCSLSEE